MKRISTIAAAGFLLLSGCASSGSGSGVGFQVQPANPDTVQRIVRECTASGLFKQVSGLALSAIPVPMAGVSLSFLLDAGIDKVCANPEQFAAAEGTVVWLTKNFASNMAINRNRKARP